MCWILRQDSRKLLESTKLFIEMKMTFSFVEKIIKNSYKIFTNSTAFIINTAALERALMKG